MGYALIAVILGAAIGGMGDTSGYTDGGTAYRQPPEGLVYAGTDRYGRNIYYDYE